MADLIPMLAAVAGQAGEEADDNFNQTVLLLHGDGTNGAQNNTFLDGSTNNFTITRNGNTTQGTFSPFSLAAGEWSNYFDDSGDYLRTPSNAAISPESSDFCFETWAYFSGSSVASRPLYELAIVDVGPNTNGLFIGTDPTNFIVRRVGVTNIITEAFPPANEWVHIAVTRSGTDWRLFFNGVQQGSTASYSYTFASGRAFIGANTGLTAYFQGNLSNYRLVKGSAVYTSAFTPPTAPLTAISGTSLLTCQSNRFVDNSTNAFAITRNGDVRVTPFSPFAPSAAYDPAVNGGSGYFDGSGDYLSLADNAALELGSSEFTIEAWIYPTELPPSGDGYPIISKYNTTSNQRSYNLVLVNDSGTQKIGLWITTTGSSLTNNFTAAYTTPLNSWTHVAAVRSVDTITIYVNGTVLTSGSFTGTVFNGSALFQIGRQDALTVSDPYHGYISNARLVVGSAVYTAAFTPPTAPLTAITNTSLLLNFTNAGILDNTGKNNLETVGNAQIDTTTKKYGTGSMEFDGTGDWLLMPNTPDQQLGTGNFTIELWVYLATGDIGSARGLVAKGTSTTGLLVSLDSSEKVVFTYTTSTITSSGAINTNAWNHIAVVREGTGSNQTKIYINGTNDGTGTVSTDFNQTSVMYVGANRTGGNPMKGFIDDLRITKGVARYTANFTVPGKAFPDL